MVACYTPPPKGKRTRRFDPDKWVTGPDPLRRNKYYAYLKHRAQAKYRGESYSLTWEDWETVWEDHLWEQRGKGSQALCLAQIDCDKGWHAGNVEIISRNEQVSKTHLGRRKNAGS